MSYKYIQASLQSVFLKNWFLLKKTNFFFYNFQYSCIRSDQRNLKTSDWTKNREADFFIAIFKKINVFKLYLRSYYFLKTPKTLLLLSIWNFVFRFHPKWLSDLLVPRSFWTQNSDYSSKIQNKIDKSS